MDKVCLDLKEMVLTGAWQSIAHAPLKDTVSSVGFSPKHHLCQGFPLASGQGLRVTKEISIFLKGKMKSTGVYYANSSCGTQLNFKFR
ncbi:hypothetical protein FQA47_008786 [Oryzias melastigma]|uniref:Uncharacterized protein n=1 Tax=Oryzias melastigma TaxID=30732 RepID=A0A834CCP9_ORYME|nr:hypothetical protein FQA47_008786 [Oryzias melastigma]